MRPLLILAALLAVPALADPPRMEGGRDRVVVSRQELQERLDRACALLDEGIGRSDRFSEKGRAMRQARTELEGARQALANAPDLHVVMREREEHREGNERRREEAYREERREPAPPAPIQMTGPRFSELIRALAHESFSQNKLQVLSAAAENQYFVVAQVQQVLQTFNFPNDRLAAVRVLQPHIIDGQNNFLLYSSFEFPHDKEELGRLLHH